MEDGLFQLVNTGSNGLIHPGNFTPEISKNRSKKLSRGGFSFRGRGS